MSKLRVKEISHSNGTQAMTIDADGRITTPARPSFEVSKNATTNGTANTYVPVGWETERHDIGNCFDLTNNRFVAPIDGVYHFSFSILLSGVDAADDAIHCSFFVNGSQKNYYSRNIGESANTTFGYGGFLPQQGSQTMKLSANDYVDIRFSSTGVINVYSGEDWSTFSGFLVG